MSLVLIPLALTLQSGSPVDAPEPPPEDQTAREPPWEAEPPPVDSEIIEGRRRPDYTGPLPDPVTQDNPGAVRAPPPEAFPIDDIPIPDRWRLIETLGLVKERFWDPYNQNTYKGDRPINPDKVPWLPIKGNDWFFVLNAISDTVIEPRTFPIPVGVQTTEDPDRIDVFGDDFSTVLSQTFIVGAALLKGSTAYKPPDVEYRVTLAFNMNYVDVPERRVLFVEPSKPSRRFDHFVGVQEAFFDYHFRNTSDRYDFDSARIGIQPFQSDFRGFLFNDQQLGLRFFGTRDNNRFQYNLGAFWRLEKDTNSGLNSVVQRPRDDFVFVANAYRQDFLIPALTSQITLVYNRNREGDRIEMSQTRRVDTADIRSVSNVAILQAVAALLPRPGPGQPDRVVAVPGLVAHALGTPPTLMRSQIGQEHVAVVHDEGAVLTLD